MDTKKVWSGEFGNEYLKRNRVDWRARVPFWEMILDKTGARSAFEFGCNAGWNLTALGKAGIMGHTLGYDVNEVALDQAENAGVDVTYCYVEHTGFELAFTAGVLIHISPEDLEETMQVIIDKSCDWVLAVEYDAFKEEEINYRGQDGLLWKRPYGKLYRDMGLTLVETGEAEGFDDCTWWLFRK